MLLFIAKQRQLLNCSTVFRLESDITLLQGKKKLWRFMLPLGEMSPLILLDSSFGCFLTFTLSQDIFSFLSCKTDVLHSIK